VSVVTERDEIVDELRRADKLLLTTHENPDGDALGSLLGMHLILRQLGKDSVMFMSAKEFPLPYEYQRMPLSEVQREIPADVDERVVVFLDCGNIDRMPADFLHEGHRHVLNIDHHHDNTCFGDANLVVGHASCTAEILWDLAGDLGVEITPEIASALYIALVTDTGKFMFENTTPRAHVMAAEMIEAGVQPQEAHRSLYEGLPFARLQLLARALTAVKRYDGGQLTLTHITREDFSHSNAMESDSEGIVDHLRQVEDTVVAALVRELLEVDGRRKVSLRATDKRVDVSIIARGLGGGGHRQAAGFTTDVPMDELVERLRREIGEQLS
jgi:bifunctional oligoribonuclease and PAP phosphatase NrnA